MKTKKCIFTHIFSNTMLRSFNGKEKRIWKIQVKTNFLCTKDL